MQTYRLIAHPAHPPRAVTAVDVEWRGDGSALALRYRISGGQLRLPAAGDPVLRDELWRSTCAELFWRGVDVDTYAEFNFAPSGEWAAYQFAARREGRADRPLPMPPRIVTASEGAETTIAIALDGAALPVPAACNLTAVIEETDGTKSYWALAHPAGAPDFHAPETFALTVPKA